MTVIVPKGLTQADVVLVKKTILIVFAQRPDGLSKMYS